MDGVVVLRNQSEVKLRRQGAAARRVTRRPHRTGGLGAPAAGRRTTPASAAKTSGHSGTPGGTPHLMANPMTPETAATAMKVGLRRSGSVSQPRSSPVPAMISAMKGRLSRLL